MGKRQSLWLFLLLILGTFAAACSKETLPAITRQDRIDVMVEVARSVAGSKVLPAGYCVDTRLDSSKAILGGPTDKMGWASDSALDLSYRLLESPNLQTLPSKAVVVLPPESIRTNCRHRLVIHEPQFIEMREGSERYLYAMLAVDDLCPLCGSGFSLGVRKYGTSWKADSSELSQSWIS